MDRNVGFSDTSKYNLKLISCRFVPLSSIIIHYHPLSSIIHPLSSIIIHYHPLSSIITHYHPFSSIIIHYHPFSRSIPLYMYIFPSNILFLCWLKQPFRDTPNQQTLQPRHTSPPSTLLALAPPAPAARCRCQRLPRPELCGPPDLKGTKKLEVLMAYSNC